MDWGTYIWNTIMTQTIQKLQGIPAPTRKGNKIEGEFYPLQKEELIALRRSRLINNAAFVHLALRYENPFCDRPLEIFPKQFALRWSIPESSVYEAIAKLKQKGVINTRSGKIILQWVHCQQDTNSDNPEFLQDSRMDSEIRENIPKSQNEFRNPRMDSEIPENRASKGALDKGSDPFQTIQTIQTYQTRGGVENFSPNSDLNSVNKEIYYHEQNYSEQERDKEKKLVNNKNSGKDQSSASVVQVTTEINTGQEISPEAKAKAKKISHEAADIPQDLITKLKELGITIDGEVKRAIANHDISQAYGAIKHVENTWETINNPRGVFLFQIPKQRIQKGPPPISESFLEWYEWAIADGLVVDYPAKYLPTNFKGEPKVKLTIDPGWAEDWQKVRDNPDNYRQTLDPTVKKELWAKVGSMLGRPPKPETEPTLNDQLNDPILGPELYPKIKHTHNVEFTEEGRPYQATPITDIEYDSEGMPVEEGI